MKAEIGEGPGHKLQPQKQAVLLLKTACFFLFAGRAWQHVVWDAPFRALLWDQDLMEGLVTWLTGSPWNDYVTDPATDIAIQYTIKGFGWFYAACALTSLFVSRARKWTGILILAGSGLLTFLAALYWKESHYQAGMFFEQALQFTTPLLLCLSIFACKLRLGELYLWMRPAIACTFVAHGLYAVGYYPQPGLFIDMFIAVLGVDEGTASSLLFHAGLLDFALSVAIFIRPLAPLFLAYAAFWGLITALARIVANFHPALFWDSINQYLPEMLHRLPHALVPLTLLLLLRSRPVRPR